MSVRRTTRNLPLANDGKWADTRPGPMTRRWLMGKGTYEQVALQDDGAAIGLLECCQPRQALSAASKGAACSETRGAVRCRNLVNGQMCEVRNALIVRLSKDQRSNVYDCRAAIHCQYRTVDI